MTTRFSKPSIDAKAFEYLRESLESGRLEGDGPFTARCHAWLKSYLGSPVLLTHSCTAALEMSALLAEVGPGDEIIMPSYTFVSTANAFVLRGATPVFVDIRADTLNLDERLIAQALSQRTKAVVPVHYAGVACDMDAVQDIARQHGLLVIEDAAQGFGARYRGRLLGTIGDLGCLSFHVTKNVISGEGGALILNDQNLHERALIVREKGTNRTAFRDRKVDKYEWLDLGSSYLPSDILAALLLAQLEAADAITQRRLAVWQRYHAAFAAAERANILRRPIVPQDCEINGHIYYLLLRSAQEAGKLREVLAIGGVPTQTHYVPLHSSPAGRRYGRVATTMDQTDRAAETLVRLPIHAEMTPDDAEQIAGAVLAAVGAFP